MKDAEKINNNIKELIQYLEKFVTKERIEKINTVLESRTRHLTVVLEDIYQPHNASAVMRSCDVFGIQDVHVIENENEYTVNPDIVLGSTKWLNIIKYNEQPHNSKSCLLQLKKENYKIIAASPYKNNSLEELSIDNKTAIIFGTEMRGLSDIAYEMADDFVKIPMYGFTQSLNVSVSAAICLYQLTNRIRKSNIDWKLKPYEIEKTKLQWLKNSIKNSQMLIDEFFKNKS